MKGKGFRGLRSPPRGARPVSLLQPRACDQGGAEGGDAHHHLRVCAGALPARPAGGVHRPPRLPVETSGERPRSRTGQARSAGPARGRGQLTGSPGEVGSEGRERGAGEASRGHGGLFGGEASRGRAISPGVAGGGWQKVCGLGAGSAQKTLSWAGWEGRRAEGRQRPPPGRCACLAERRR